MKMHGKKNIVCYSEVINGNEYHIEKIITNNKWVEYKITLSGGKDYIKIHKILNKEYGVKNERTNL